MLGSRESNTKGIVIARASSGDGSVRVSLFTEKFGLIWCLAKSAREERSKLRPHLQVGTYGIYTLVKGAQNWRVLGAVDTKNSYFSLREIPEAQKGAVRVFGAVRQLIQGELQDQMLFEAFWNFLEALQSVSLENAPLAERAALIQILFRSGYISNEDLPDIPSDFYSEGAYEVIRSNEKTLTKVINEGFSASGLV